MSGTCCTPCQPFTERHGHCQRPRRVAGYARTRGHAAGTARGLDASACARSGRARHSPQCQHMTCTASRSGATHAELGPPRRARVDARDARERMSHGPRSASSASAAAPGGRSGRLGASDRARASREVATKKDPKLPSLSLLTSPWGKKSSFLINYFRQKFPRWPTFTPPTQRATPCCSSPAQPSAPSSHPASGSSRRRGSSRRHRAPRRLVSVWCQRPSRWS